MAKVFKLNKRMKQILKAYKLHNAVVYKTCEACNISRNCFYNLKNKHPEFSDMLDEEKYKMHDALENTMWHKALKKDNTVMQIFLAKTQMGYRETTEVINSGRQEQIVYDVSAMSKEQIREHLGDPDGNEFEDSQLYEDDEDETLNE